MKNVSERNQLKDPQAGDVFTTMGIFPELITILYRGRALAPIHQSGQSIRVGADCVHYRKECLGVEHTRYCYASRMIRDLRSAIVGKRIHARPGSDETWQISVTPYNSEASQ